MSRSWIPNVHVRKKSEFVWRVQPNGTIQSGVTMNEIIKRLERQGRMQRV